MIEQAQLIEQSGGRKVANIGKPYRVKEDWASSRWTYETGKAKPATFPWTRRFKTGDRLGDPENATFLETARRYLAICTEGLASDSDGLALSTAFARTSTLIAIMGWARVKGHRSLATLSFDEISELKQEVRTGLGDGKKNLPGRTSKSTHASIRASNIQEIYRVLFDVWEYFAKPSDDGYYLLDDGPTYQPFTDWMAAKQAARVLGRPYDQLEDVPHQVVFRYLNASIEYVFDYADEIIELRKRVADYNPSVVSRGGHSAGFVRNIDILIAELKQPHAARALRPPVTVGTLTSRSGSSSLRLAAKHRLKEAIRLYERSFNAESSGAKDHDSFVELVAMREESAAFEGGNTGSLPDSDLNQWAFLPYSGKRDGPSSPWPIQAIEAKGVLVKKNLEAATSSLWSSCYIIVASFMAERLDETLGLKVDCLERGIDGWYLKGLTYKTGNTLSGTATKHPCPVIVVRAVEIARRLGQDMRQRLGNDLLFVDPASRSEIPDASTVRNKLKRFGQLIDAGPEAMEWKLIPRNLRRFFATAWVHYYSYGAKFDALREYLNHDELTTTALYGYRVTQGRTVRDDQADLLLSVNHQSAFEGVDLQGPGALTLKRIYREAKVRFATQEEQEEEIKEQARRRRIIVYPTPWGMCLWSMVNRARAKCGTPADKGTATSWPMGKKTHLQCGSCINFVAWGIFKPFWKGALKRHKLAASNPRAPKVVIKVANDGIKLAEHYLAVL